MEPTEPDIADTESFTKTTDPTSTALTLFSSFSNGILIKLLKAVARLPSVSDRLPNMPIDDTILSS